MSGLHTKAPPRPPKSEEEALEHSRLCIRVMERFFEAVNDNPQLESGYLDLLNLYMDVLQDELAPYAFDLAYELFSEEELVKERRRELALESDGSDA